MSPSAEAVSGNLARDRRGLFKRAPPSAGARAAPSPERAHEGTDTGVTKRRCDVVDGHLRVPEQLARDLESNLVQNALKGHAVCLEAPVQSTPMHRQHLRYSVPGNLSAKKQQAQRPIDLLEQLAVPGGLGFFLSDAVPRSIRVPYRMIQPMRGKP